MIPSRSTVRRTPSRTRGFADALAMLRAIASGPGISRELWVFLPRGAFRFFRVTDTGLIELNRDGSVMPEKPKPVVVAMPALPGQPAKPPQETPAREALAGPETIPPAQAPRGDSSVGEKTPGEGQGG